MKHHLEHILRCPLTGDRLTWLEPETLARFNQQIQSGELKHFSKEIVTRTLEAGLINIEKTVVYPIEHDIVFMLPEFAIVLQPLETQHQPGDYSSKVRQFYETFGWKKTDEGTYKDTERHVDMRPITREYLSKCLSRVRDYLPEQGTYLLDVASGPVAFSEHRQYSENYTIRVCVDIALSALLEAQRNLPPGHGIFVLGNITDLPLQPDVMDAVVSLHTIYHIPAESQKQAFDQLYRVLKPGGNAVIVYSWGQASLLMNLFFGVYYAFKHLRARPTDDSKPSLYFYAHPYRWFKQQVWDFELQILSWRSLSLPFLRYFIHPILLGKLILAFAFLLENRFPALMGRIGQYPMFIVRK